jgi:GH24 family phage-related lysozyme (muramidase)
MSFALPNAERSIKEEPKAAALTVQPAEAKYDPAWIAKVKEFECYELCHGKIAVSIIHPDGLKKGVWEVGYGVTQAEVDEAILFGLLPPGTKLPERMTKAEANDWFEKITIPVYERFVNEIVSVTLTPEQRFALISFCHNLGSDNLKKLVAQTGRLNDKNYRIIEEYIPQYVNAGSHKDVPGLIKRRGWELELWRQGSRSYDLVSR